MYRTRNLLSHNDLFDSMSLLRRLSTNNDTKHPIFLRVGHQRVSHNVRSEALQYIRNLRTRSFRASSNRTISSGF